MGIELRRVEKFFPGNGVRALSGADFELLPGEIHALVGENGAGKSTLMHIMAGFLSADGGSVIIDGTERRLKNPAAALALGIGMVRQHPRLVPAFRVWESCSLGFSGWIRKESWKRRVEELSRRWGFDLDAERLTNSLSVGERQKCAVLALLLRNVQYLILDEPTAVLSPAETERLFELLEKLRADGRGIALISHKLEETLRIAGRITVLRKGRTVACKQAGESSPDEISSLIFGSARERLPASETKKPVAVLPMEDQDAAIFPVAKDKNPVQENILEVTALSVEIPGRPFIRSVSFALAPRTITGIAGVRDSGLESLELALTGFLSPASGAILVAGTKISGKGPRAFRRAGGGYLCADRTGTALAMQLPLFDSLIIHAHRRAEQGPLGALGIINASYLYEWSNAIMRQAAIFRSPGNRADSFSGGMLQRLVLARELAEPVKLLILAEPGWGLDAAGQKLLEKRLRDFASSGGAVLLISTDIEELMTLSDSILVLRDGKISDKLDREEFHLDRIGRAMVGAFYV
ncbi:MAG: ATP-binding cassette domain-containing protein [Spirochaetaceae bacterium]|nr:ATP-binding cassette domain-containing protein [Spirochaetaceae bacterium]